MKITSRLLFFFFACSILISCGNDKSVVVTTVQTINTDSIALTDLVRNSYAWYEKIADAGFIDFEPSKKNPADTFYSGIDMEKHRGFLHSMEASGLFIKGFITNYDSIALYIDTQLKNGEEIWLIGDMSPFSDCNPWYEAQDYSETQTKLEKITINNDVASFVIKDYNIQARANKENGTWKISYLQGLDINHFTPCAN